MALAGTQVAYTRVEDSYSFRADNAIDPALRKRIAVSLGYDPEDISKIPEDANIGEGCGNPLLIATLAEVCITIWQHSMRGHPNAALQGEKVVDLGCGGGFDVFLASKKVGPNGRVIGVDMTEVSFLHSSQLISQLILVA